MRSADGSMKIAFIHDYQPNLGGTTEVVIRMARAFRRRGHSCKLITHPESWIRERDKENLELVRSRMFKITFMQYVPHNSAKVAKIVSLYRHRHTDLCHAHYALPYGLVGFLAKQICGIPYVVTLHGTDIHTLASMPALKPVMRLCLENADAVTSVCEYLAAAAARKLDLHKSIIAIPNFVDTRRFHERPPSRALRDEFDIPRGHPVVTHISNYAAIKNTLIIPEIAQLVLQRHPRTIFLMVGEALGEEGFELDDLKKKVSQLGLDPDFRFVGRRKDIPGILDLSEISLITSLNEGSPLALIESLAVGVPVVSSRVGGVPELIKHGVNGFLVERQRIERYAKYICRLIEHPSLRHTLGRHGVAQVHDKYREEVVINQYLNLYKAVLESSRQEQIRRSSREAMAEAM
jgi:N-acetyl-alpha-D-glucosaminyl L-malate synthase BshA